eukprot:171623_1
MAGKNSTFQPQPQQQAQAQSDVDGSLLIGYKDVPSYRLLAIGLVVLFCMTCILVWNWRRHKLSKDDKLGFAQTKCPFFTDTVLLLWGLGSGYGIIFAIKSPFYEIFQISKSIGIVFKGVGAILLGFIIGATHVYYESENDYHTIRRSLSEIGRLKMNFHKKIPLIKCNFKDIFLVFWSYSSGYGIIFAIESYIYELFGFKSRIAFIIKPCVALIVGVGIGIVHFHFDVVQTRIYDRKKHYSVVNAHATTVDTDTDFDTDFNTDNESDLNDNENDLDDNESDLDCNEIENSSVKLEIGVPTSVEDNCSLERTATIDEEIDEEFDIDKQKQKNKRKWKLSRSRTYDPNPVKLSTRSLTM